MADTGSFLDHGLGREHLVPGAGPSSHPRGIRSASGSICRQSGVRRHATWPQKADLRGCGRSPPPLGCRPRRQARQHRLAGAPSPAPLETAPPATVRWSPEAPPTPGRGTVPNTWASATETALSDDAACDGRTPPSWPGDGTEFLRAFDLECRLRQIHRSSAARRSQPSASTPYEDHAEIQPTGSAGGHLTPVFSPPGALAAHPAQFLAGAGFLLRPHLLSHWRSSSGFLAASGLTWPPL